MKTRVLPARRLPLSSLWSCAFAFGAMPTVRQFAAAVHIYTVVGAFIQLVSYSVSMDAFHSALPNLFKPYLLGCPGEGIRPSTSPDTYIHCVLPSLPRIQRFTPLSTDLQAFPKHVNSLLRSRRLPFAIASLPVVSRNNRNKMSRAS
jgi:hypothetical protein